MASRILTALSFFILVGLFSLSAQAQVEWNEPEVVPEKLTRQNRRVLRFSGATQPGAQVRVRKGRVKMYPPGKKGIWRNIPQRNRIQFPVVADENGEFVFDLYLPTWAVEIPVEVYQGGKWVPYSLNFKVPDEGAADDFQAVDESFKEEGDLGDRAEKSLGEYSRKDDQGLVIGDHYGEKERKHLVWAWGSIALAYTSQSYDEGSFPYKVDADALTIPSWRLGIDYSYKNKLKGKLAIRSTSGDIDSPTIPTGIINGTSFDWTEAQLGLVWFTKARIAGGRFGWDLGLQYHSLPYFRLLNSSVTNFTYFSNTAIFMHIGGHWESKRDRSWPFEIYGRYLYPLSTGDNFNIESSFPITMELGGGLTRHLIPGLKFGLFSQIEYLNYDTSYPGVSSVKYSLMLVTVEARIYARF